MKEELQARIDKLKIEVDNSANHHNMLIGRYIEALHLMKVLKEAEQKAKDELENTLKEPISD